MRWVALLAIIAALGCISPPGESVTTGAVQGTLDTTGIDAGNGFVFLYPGTNPPAPAGSGRPVQVTGVPEPRLFGGQTPNPDYVIANVPPGDYLARGIIDRRHLFDPFIDVMAQPFAGDISEPLVPLSVTAGQTTVTNLPAGQTIAWEPPMFVMDTLPGDVKFTLGSTEQVISILHLTATPLPFSDPSLVAFQFQSTDGGGQLSALSSFGGLGNLGSLGGILGRGGGGRHGGGGLRGVLDGGTAGLSDYPEVILSRVPSSSDGPAFKDAAGNPLTIVLAAVAQPDTSVRDDMINGQEVVDGLYIFIAPVAELVTTPSDGGATTATELPSVPVGTYAITVVEADGRYWQVPNELAPGNPFASQYSGPFASQAPRFEVVEQ